MIVDDTSIFPCRLEKIQVVSGPDARYVGPDNRIQTLEEYAHMVWGGKPHLKTGLKPGNPALESGHSHPGEFLVYMLMVAAFINPVVFRAPEGSRWRYVGLCGLSVMLWNSLLDFEVVALTGAQVDRLMSDKRSCLGWRRKYVHGLVEDPVAAELLHDCAITAKPEGRPALHRHTLCTTRGEDFFSPHLPIYGGPIISWFDQLSVAGRSIDRTGAPLADGFLSNETIKPDKAAYRIMGLIGVSVRMVMLRNILSFRSLFLSAEVMSVARKSLASTQSIYTALNFAPDPQTANRRMQFCALYPEFAGIFQIALTESAGKPIQDAPVALDLIRRIDAGEPVAESLSRASDAPKWLIRAARGLFVCRGTLYDRLCVEPFNLPFYKQLQNLPPECVPTRRHMAFAEMVCHMTLSRHDKQPFSMCLPKPSKGRSSTYWKDLRARFPSDRVRNCASFKNQGWSGHSYARGVERALTADVNDCRRAFFTLGRLVMLRLMPPALISANVNLFVEGLQALPDISMLICNGRAVEFGDIVPETRPALEYRGLYYVPATFSDVSEPAIRILASPRDIGETMELTTRYERLASSIVDATNSAVAEATRLLDDERLSQHSSEWLPLLPRTSFEGLDLEFLTTVAQLVRTGQVMSHCVASYTTVCLTSQTHILNISEEGRILSTAEIRLCHAAIEDESTWEFCVVQHRGAHNAEPPVIAKAAFAAFMKHLNDSSTISRLREHILEIHRLNALERAKTKQHRLADLMVDYTLTQNDELFDRVLVAWRRMLPSGARSCLRHDWSAGQRVSAFMTWFERAVRKNLGDNTLDDLVLAMGGGHYPRPHLPANIRSDFQETTPLSVIKRTLRDAVFDETAGHRRAGRPILL